MDLSVCFIISKSHLAHLQTTLRSLRQFHPKCRAYVLFLDSVPVEETGTDDFEIFTLQDLGHSVQDVMEILKNLSVFELACLMKACFIKHLFKKKRVQKLFYLDTDLYFFHGIEEEVQKLNSCNLLLTPHLIEPSLKASPQQKADEAVIVGNGLYNMGFFGIRQTPETLRFLDWWFDRKSFYCKRDISRGFFDDQKWVDPVPIYFEGVLISKNKGLNVANWNLHERPISKKKGKYWVEDKPLVFFHFSRFRPDQSYRLSQYRFIRLEDFSYLREICQEYKEKLHSHNWMRFSQEPFSLFSEIQS